MAASLKGDLLSFSLGWKASNLLHVPTSVAALCFAVFLLCILSCLLSLVSHTTQNVSYYARSWRIQQDEQRPLSPGHTL